MMQVLNNFHQESSLLLFYSNLSLWLCLDCKMAAGLPDITSKFQVQEEEGRANEKLSKKCHSAGISGLGHVATLSIWKGVLSYGAQNKIRERRKGKCIQDRQGKAALSKCKT